MKAYTDLEQSRKLAEILPIESADYHYIAQGQKSYFYPYSLSIGVVEQYNGDIKYIPCWSLSALLEAMPEYIRKYDGRVYRNYHLNLYRSYYHCCSYSFGPSTKDNDDDTLYCVGREDWVDACVDMVIELKELKML